MTAESPTKVAIVTGASSGIGLATVNTLIAAPYNYRVLGVDISDSPSTLSRIPETQYRHLKIDLTSKEAPATVVKAAIDAFTRLDALCNVAGVMDNLGSVDTMDDDMWERNIAVNLTAPVKLMREAVRVFTAGKNGGAIVNVASKAGMSGGAAGVSYTASKHGLIGATKQVAFRFRDDKIRCNAVAPGSVQTNIASNFDHSKFDLASLAKIKPVMSAHTKEEDQFAPTMVPEQVASTIAFLVDDRLSSAISGAIIPIDMAWSTI